MYVFGFTVIVIVGLMVMNVESKVDKLSAELERVIQELKKLR